MTPPRYHDWAEAADYDTEARAQLTELVLELRRATEALHIIVGSRTVEIGVTVANLALRVLVLHRNRAAFEAACQEALRGAERAARG